MLRGLVSLTPAQAQALFDEIHDQIKGDQLLLDRIELIAQTNSLTPQLQLSEDEAEFILDLLPAPQSISNPDLSGARVSLQQFLTKLKWPKAD